MPACTAGEKFQQALQLIQTTQEHFVSFSEKEESASVAGAKAATVLTLAVLKKTSSFDAEDWKDLGGNPKFCVTAKSGANREKFIMGGRRVKRLPPC